MTFQNVNNYTKLKIQCCHIQYLISLLSTVTIYDVAYISTLIFQYKSVLARISYCNNNNVLLSHYCM